MPVFELALLFKILPRAELSAVLKRTAMLLFDRNYIVHSINNYGTKDLPYMVRQNDILHKKGSHFVFEFSSNLEKLPEVRAECELDTDIIRFSIERELEPYNAQCTLEEELLPPVYRPSVINMLETARRKKAFKAPKRNFKTPKEYNYFDIYA